jgi:hypothetical protein
MIARGQVGRKENPGRGEADSCHPQHCVVAGEPHDHCVCGLPMTAEARCCRFCEVEGLELDRVVLEDEALAWDGVRYASFRRHRRVGAYPERYQSLLAEVLAPGQSDEVAA